MTKINTFRASGKCGFLLLDIMISIVLISLSMLILGHYTLALIEHNHDTQLTLRALNRATDLLDRCISSRKIPVHTTQQMDPFSIEWQIEQHALLRLSNVPIVLVGTE